MKLGRKAVKTDSRTLRLGAYLTPVLPDPPPAQDWTAGVTAWGMMMNDQVGDCTIAAAAHAVQVWSVNAGAMVTVPDPTILGTYEKWDGYVAGDPTTDNGGIALDVLNDWHQEGLDGHTLVAFADPSVANLTEIRQSIALFGGVYIGLQLPITAQTQDVWDVVPGGGANAVKDSWGGHCVFVPKYDQDGFTCITWGQLKTMTLAFFETYCDEAHALLGQNWLTVQGSPVGFDQVQLLTDLHSIK
jgi:hypothetical protein